MIAYPLRAHTVEIDLKLYKGHDWPTWRFEQPYTMVSIEKNDTMQLVRVTINLDHNHNTVKLLNFGKKINDTVIENNAIVRDQAIEIHKIWINGVLLELLSLQNSFEFYPEYQKSDWDYAHDQGISLPSCRNETQLFYNGCWQFVFEQPFFPWYNNQLMAKLVNVNHWAKSSNLGIATDSQLQRLDRLLDQLSQ